MLRNRFGRLIRQGGGTFVLNSKNTYLSKINRHAKPFIKVSQYGVYDEARHYYVQTTPKDDPRSEFFDVEEEAAGGSLLSWLLMQTIMCSKQQGITAGSIINLQDFLFTENRDYLVKYDHSQQVNAEHLADKVTVVLFLPLSLASLDRRRYIDPLKDV